MTTSHRYMLLAMLNVFEAGALILNLLLRGVNAGDPECKAVEHKLNLGVAALNGAPWVPPPDQKN